MFKRHGAERSGKDTVTTVSGRCKEADPPRRRTADEVSKRLVVLQKLRFPRPKRPTVADSCLLATGRPALRRQELYTGFYSERERLPYRCAVMQ